MNFAKASFLMGKYLKFIIGRSLFPGFGSSMVITCLVMKASISDWGSCDSSLSCWYSPSAMGSGLVAEDSTREATAEVATEVGAVVAALAASLAAFFSALRAAFLAAFAASSSSVTGQIRSSLPSLPPSLPSLLSSRPCARPRRPLHCRHSLRQPLRPPSSWTFQICPSYSSSWTARRRRPRKLISSPS